ncbi:glycerophosphodiester phosphodiesterase [Pseudogracilibacillus sp. ICA-222130]|uniref:glycerophosphodiester phosphodiesterase n=1 Tax=Pseudogracilibacillus sp. ICA-222130 TaxID=3134655 RepID=UPI0030BBB6EC
MKIIAHRGASKFAPENTIASFKKAIELQADAIELDVRLTKDGELVLSHDSTIKRLTNKKGFVHNYTLKQLKSFDFGSKFSKKFKGEKIATFDEALQLLKQTEITLHIELKNGPVMMPHLEEKVLQLVSNYHMEDRVIYSSFDHKSLQQLYRLDPNVKLSVLFFGNLVDPFYYIDHLSFPLYGIHPNHFYVTEQMVQEAKKRHLQTNVYTVNDIDFATHYKNIGVDGLITNNPSIFK